MKRWISYAFDIVITLSLVLGVLREMGVPKIPLLIVWAPLMALILVLVVIFSFNAWKEWKH